MTNELLRGRQTALVLTNKSGGGVVEGDVVIVDGTADESFTTTAVEGQSAEMVGVALETIANNDLGRVCVAGYVAQVNLDVPASYLDWIKTDGVAKQATPQAAPGVGTFGQVLAEGPAPSAIIFPHPMLSAGAGGNTLDEAYDEGGAGAGRTITADNGAVAIAGTDGLQVANTADIQELRVYDSIELTIAAGVITRTQTYHSVDTAGDIASDDLDTINGGAEGDFLVIRAEHADRTVVVKHGTGNIYLASEDDIYLEDAEDHLVLIYDGTNSVWASIGLAPKPDSCSATRTSTQSVANNTWTDITLPSEEWDTASMHDGGGANPERITCRKVGKYIVTGWIEWAANANGGRILALRRNDSYICRVIHFTGGNWTTWHMISAQTIEITTAGQYFTLTGFQGSGGALNVANARLTATLIAKE